MKGGNEPLTIDTRITIIKPTQPISRTQTYFTLSVLHALKWVINAMLALHSKISLNAVIVPK
jgi:hypothetical protein